MRPSSLSQICLFPAVHSKSDLRFSSHRPLSHFTSFPVQSVIPTHGSPMHNLNILGRAAFTRNGQLSIRPAISMAIVPLTCLDLGMSSKEKLNYGKKIFNRERTARRAPLALDMFLATPSQFISDLQKSAGIEYTQYSIMTSRLCLSQFCAQASTFVTNFSGSYLVL